MSRRTHPEALWTGRCRPIIFLPEEDAMGLVIEGDALQAKAKRLAELTGTSIAVAVNDAIDRRLAELERSREAEVRRRSRRMLEIGRQFAEHPPPDHDATPTDRADLLHDKDGLPR